MKDVLQLVRYSVTAMMLLSVTVFSDAAQSKALTPLVDDFSNPTKNSLGIERLFMTDQTAGGGTTSEVQVVNGVMQVTGDLLPARGQPGWSSSVLLLDQQNTAQDASQFQGVRLRVRMTKGNLTVSANSTEVTNFDYHAAAVTVPTDGQFHQVDIPFNSMKPAWSAATALDPKTLASLSIVAFSLQPSSYDFELDYVSFY